MSDRLYDVSFFIGPCDESDADALAGAIIDLPEFARCYGGAVGLRVIAETGDDAVREAG